MKHLTIVRTVFFVQDIAQPLFSMIFGSVLCEGKPGFLPLINIARFGGMGCLAIMILALIAMPLVGLYLILRHDGDGETKAVGWILLIVSCMI